MRSAILNKINWKSTFIVIICFLTYKYSKYFYAYVIFGKEEWKSLPFYIPSSIMMLTGIIMGLVADYFINKRIVFSDFGLSRKGFVKGFLYALLFSLPMLIGLGVTSNFNFRPEAEKIYRGIVLAGFGEEFIFRAFLFGLLFYYCGWGFLSAGILSGLFFGAVHLYQAHDLGSAISVFLFTTGASIGFAWFYYAWKDLWMVVFLHGFMDVLWDSFHVQSNVTGNTMVNLARFSTLVLAIIISIRIAKKNGRYDLRRKLWIHSPH